MLSRLVLLTGPPEAEAFVRVFRPLLDGAELVAAHDLAGLQAALDGRPGTRLFAFCTAVIVPPALLGRVDRGAYNLHPGSPDYPGRYPESFACYAGVSRFGATLHHMVPRVDEGPIVAVEWFDVPPGIGQGAMAEAVYRAALALLLRWAPALAAAPPLPADPALAWRGRKTTRAQHEAMCRLAPDIDRTEFERRRRAFADAPGTRLTVTLHGCEFEWRAPSDPA